MADLLTHVVPWSVEVITRFSSARVVVVVVVVVPVVVVVLVLVLVACVTWRPGGTERAGGEGAA